MAHPTVEAAADALLQIMVKGERDRHALVAPSPIKATPFVLRDPASIPPRSQPDLARIIADPVGTACRSELRRLGECIHTAGGDDALEAAMVEIAEMDPTHSGWRAIVLERAWEGIGARAA